MKWLNGKPPSLQRKEPTDISGANLLLPTTTQTMMTPCSPSWMLVEIMTLGTWSKVYANLKVSKDRKIISRVFDLAPDMLESWLHSLTCLRNLCAHHSPIYGRRMMAYPPQTRTGWPELPRTAFARRVAVLEYLLGKVAPGTQWGARVKTLIDGEPLVNPKLLGIQNHDFWECEL